MTMDRRSFLKGSAAVAGGVAAVGAMGATAFADEAEAPSWGTVEVDEDVIAAVDAEKSDEPPAWLGTPPDISVDDCVETVETDIVVVGSALAGVLSAYSAIQNGAQVVMIERNGAPHISGSGIGFFNSEYQKAGGQPEHNEQIIMNKVINEGNLRVDAALVAMWAYHSGEILDELEENVLQPAGLPGTISIGEPLDEEELDQYEEAFHVDFDDTGNDSLEKFDYIFHDWIREHGGTIAFNTCARVLTQDEDGTVTGLIATNEGGEYVYYKANKAVIMCAGSYGGNEEMVDALCYPSMAQFIKKYSGYNAKASETAPITTGEKMDDGIGHRMMCWAGAIMEEIDPSYQAWSNTGYWIAAPLAVNNKGERFFNEAISSLSSSFAIFELPDGANYVWQIMGSDDFDFPALLPMPGANREMMEAMAAGSEMYEADTIEELAGLIGVPADTLVATVERYNELCALGKDEDYGKGANHLHPIDTPPFKAYKEAYYFFGMSSGVKVNKNLQVVDANWDPIPHLYAAGNCVGWRMGSGYQNVIPGLCNAYAAVHGYYAGKNAAAEA